ncbi:MAG: ArnT family glycosyltransferase [Akkermansiaceae bacterium]
MSISNNSGSYDAAKIIRRATFFVILLGLATISIFFTFQGLSSPRAMEQAQIGREIARGNGYTTKVIRPVALWQMKEASDGDMPSLENLPDTYHAPLNPCVYAAVLKATDAGDNKAWRMPPRSNIYQLDRVIAVTCAIFFLIAIGVNYLLVARIFDTTIAATVALLMLFCELMWDLSQSGLPQMLMLMLFSCAMFFVWRAVENAEENRPALTSILISGVFMCLLVLTHWITIWIYIGFVIFAAFYFKPRGVIAALLAGLLAVFITPVVYFLYLSPTGSPFGTAYYVIHDGLGMSQDSIMRALSPAGQDLGLRGLLLNILATTLRQITELHKNLGAILVAPLFFVALLHPFKRFSLGAFRWLILLMWVFASLGMSIYGLRQGAMDPNQIHILFAPLMAAYGLAMVSILWARLNIPQSMNALRSAHLVLIVAISAGPMLLSIPQKIQMGIRAEGRGGFPHWPPYIPSVYNRILADNTGIKDVVISDTPWAVAWYADRMSVWLPQDLDQIEEIESLAKTQQTPVSGILITPYSYGNSNILNAVGNNSAPYNKLYPLVMGAWGYRGNSPNFMDSHPKFRSLSQRFPHKQPLYADGQIMLYSARPVTRSSD